MKIINNISYKLSKESLNKCKDLNLDDQIAFINQSIFEDASISHIDRLKHQHELLKISKVNKSKFNSAYILNLIAQTNTQLGDLSVALDNLMEAEKKWRDLILIKQTSERSSLILSGLILCLSDIGNIYMQMGLFDQAMEYFEKGLEYINDSDSLFVPYFKLHYHLAEIYNELNFHAKSNQMIKKCISRVKKFKFSPSNRTFIYLIPATMHLASLHKKEKDFQKSIDIYNETLNMCDQFSDVIYKQKILMSIGEIYIDSNEFDKAKEILGQAEAMHDKIGSISKLIDIKNNLAQVYIKQENFDKARIILESSKELAELSNLDLKLIFIYKSLSKAYENLNNSEKSFMYNKKHSKLISDYYLNKNKALINENRKTIKDLSRAIKEKHEIEIAKDIEMKKKFNIKSQTTKTLYRIRESNILESLKDDINKFKNKIDPSGRKHLNGMLKKISFHLQDQSSWKDFETMFIQIHEDFIEKLNDVSTQLTTKQIRFCMFIKMGMDKYDICNLLNVTTRAIEQQRYRIKKIISPNQDLDKFIQDI
tara:strand:- start:4090 stop:5703 length:1614 start_codon:yes stop_codon:yes gene_type:complete